jgi:hypothetical protein
MAMAVTHRVTSGLFAAMLSAIVVAAVSLHFREQSPPPAQNSAGWNPLLTCLRQLEALTRAA